MRLYLAHYRLHNGARGTLHVVADHCCTAVVTALDVFGLQLRHMSVRSLPASQGAAAMIHHSEAAPPAGLRPGYVGPAMLPGTGRRIYWTGRVAIGLRYRPESPNGVSQAQHWIQALLLSEVPA